MRLVFANELVPLSFEKDGRITGILVDIAREVFVTRLGQKVALEIYPWERAQHMVEAGSADGFITIITLNRALNIGMAVMLGIPAGIRLGIGTGLVGILHKLKDIGSGKERP